MGMALTAPRYTVDDLEQFPDDGNRYELLDGVLLVTPAPRPAHQIVAARLAFLITGTLQSGVAHVVTPGAVVSGLRTQFEPDLLVYPARFPVSGTWADVDEHWLAVEVLSRSSRVYDREFKRDAYLAMGVAEVWLVDIARREIEVCRERGKLEVVRETLVWRAPTGVEVVVKLGELFEGA